MGLVFSALPVCPETLLMSLTPHPRCHSGILLDATIRTHVSDLRTSTVIALFARRYHGAVELSRTFRYAHRKHGLLLRCRSAFHLASWKHQSSATVSHVNRLPWMIRRSDIARLHTFQSRSNSTLPKHQNRKSTASRLSTDRPISSTNPSGIDETAARSNDTSVCVRTKCHTDRCLVCA